MYCDCQDPMDSVNRASEEDIPKLRSQPLQQADQKHFRCSVKLSTPIWQILLAVRYPKNTREYNSYSFFKKESIFFFMIHSEKIQIISYSFKILAEVTRIFWLL